MIKKSILFFLCLTLFLSMPGCKKKLPTTPDIPAIILQSITVISNSDLLYIGESENFTATATMSDGNTKSVIGGVWSADNSSIATVGSGTGRVTIVGSGMVTIIVHYEGKYGSKTIRGLPNYQGTWSGNYIITSCNATDDWVTADFCNHLPSGLELLVELNLTQDEDRVEGRFLLGDLGADASGPVHTDGHLLLTGAVQEGTATIEVAMFLQSTTPGQIFGSLSQLWRATDMWGSARVDATIEDLPRISTMTMALIPSGQRMLSPTLEDLIRALIRR